MIEINFIVIKRNLNKNKAPKISNNEDIVKFKNQMIVDVVSKADIDNATHDHSSMA